MIPKHKIRHYIGGQDFGEPRNWQDLVITIDWLNRKEGVTINITDLEFVLEANNYLQQRIQNGLNGGVGIFEGEPYQIVVGNINDPVYSFDGYLDFTDETTVLGGEELVCSLKKLQGNDWINDVADSFSFAYLQDQGRITNADFIKVPYVINYVPDGTQIILLALSLYLMTKELIEASNTVLEAIADVTDASTPVVGVGTGLGAVAVIATDIGNIILVGLKLAAKLIYVVAIVVAIVNLITELFEQLLPKKRDHLGMTIRKMFQRSCEYLNMTFESTIPELEWVHVPSKDRKGGLSGETGVPTNGNAIYTFGDLIRQMSRMFNADYRISNGVFRFERKDEFRTQGDYVIPAFFSDQQRLLDVNSFNTDEMIANYNITWAFDSQDQNTLDDSEGYIFQAITTPVNVINQDLVNIKNLAEIQLPFSIGKRKNSFTDVERIAKSLGKFVDKLTGFFGKGTRFEAKIEKRIGAMLMSSHFLTFGRMVAMNGTQLQTDQRAILSSTNLWFKYHYINSFAEVQGEHNQFFKFPQLRVPMSLEDFDKILENNLCTDADGNQAEIELVEYSPQIGSAVINYRIKKKYTNNLKINYV